MGRRWRIKVEIREATFVLRGWQARELAQQAGVKVIFSGASRGWIGDRRALGDVLAWLDHRNVACDVDDTTDYPAAEATLDLGEWW